MIHSLLDATEPRLQGRDRIKSVLGTRYDRCNTDSRYDAKMCDCSLSFAIHAPFRISTTLARQNSY